MEALAFFAEDLLAPDEERSVAAHIETCANCATTLDELSGVTRVLAEAPAPALPQDVADLLDGRIAEAVNERSAAASSAEIPAPETPVPGPYGPESTAPGTPADDALAPVVPIAARRRRFGLPHLMAVAAASVFVVGGGAAIINGVMGGQQESGVASPLMDEDAEPEVAPDTAQSYSAESVASGTVYTEEGLGAQAAAVLAEAESEEPEEGTGAQALEGLPSGAQECVTRFEEANGVRITLVDDAYFDSGDGAERAWVLFTRDTDGVSAVVLDPAHCVQGGPDSGVITEQPL
ncbi:anti-sigma factor family protein [Nocardiopsis valliformis]|uniref:anti-sigma factor family protein n=1 Tax=Nocardiopsis valliformis TaxID=239974 RepID=UPI000347E2A4